jgi:hypothetical protein
MSAALCCVALVLLHRFGLNSVPAGPYGLIFALYVHLPSSAFHALAYQLTPDSGSTRAPSPPSTPSRCAACPSPPRRSCTSSPRSLRRPPHGIPVPDGYALPPSQPEPPAPPLAPAQGVPHPRLGLPPPRAPLRTPRRVEHRAPPQRESAPRAGAGRAGRVGGRAPRPARCPRRAQHPRQGAGDGHPRDAGRRGRARRRRRVGYRPGRGSCAHRGRDHRVRPLLRS